MADMLPGWAAVPISAGQDLAADAGHSHSLSLQCRWYLPEASADHGAMYV